MAIIFLIVRGRKSVWSGNPAFRLHAVVLSTVIFADLFNVSFEKTFDYMLFGYRMFKLQEDL